MSLERTLAQVVIGADKASLKRLAWAYGCAKKDSDVERQLGDLLIDRVRRELPERARMHDMLAKMRTLRDRGRVTDAEMTQLVYDFLDILRGTHDYLSESP